MTRRSDNCLSPREFAACIGTNVQFVRKRLSAGDIPYRKGSGKIRLIHHKHIKRYKPYPEGMKLFSTEDAIVRTGLSKQTICDLLKKGYVQYTQTDRRNRHCRKKVSLDAARPVNKWLIPEKTMHAFLVGVKPNIENWPTADEVAERIGASTAYVLKLYEQGQICGQQSILRQRVHIRPADAAALPTKSSYEYSVGHVSRLTGLATQTIADILRRGHFTQRRTNAKGAVASDRVAIRAEKRLGQCWLSREGVESLLKGVRPALLHWPTADGLEQRFGLTRGTVSRYFNKGRIRGCISIKGQGKRLHIHPSDFRLFVLQHRYSISRAAEQAGVTVQTLRKWNKRAPEAFLKHGLGREEYVPPHIFGRMRFLAKHNALNSKTSQILTALHPAFVLYTRRHLFNTLLYDADRPPRLCECREGMSIELQDRRRGIITRIRSNRYRPAIEVLMPDETSKEQHYLYALATS